jgi:DNA ligase (NAD+)
MKKLKEWQFPIVVHKTATHTTLTKEMLTDDLLKRRSEGLYDIDGIVVVDSSKSYDLTDCNPSHGFAFKTVLKDQVAETTILEVIWTPSMYGYLKPKIKIKPVTLSGVTIKHVTAFNAKYVKDNVIGPGAVIKLVRSGDVIPHILEVLKPSTSKKPSMPDMAYTWDKTNTNIIIKDLHGDAKDTVVTKKIANFFIKLGVKHISRGIVAKLVDAGYDTVIKILKADHADLAEVDGLGATSVAKIFEGLKEAFKTVTLEKLLAGSMVMGQGMGVRKSKLVMKAYPNIMNETWTASQFIEKIKEVDGFDTKTATQFATNFSTFKKFYKELGKIKGVDIKHLDIVETTKNKDKSDKKKATKSTNRFEGQKVVFTGFRDKDMEAVIEAEGGSVTGSVSKNTTLVVHADTGASKYKKAVELGVKTMTKDDFLKKYR